MQHDHSHFDRVLEALVALAKLSHAQHVEFQSAAVRVKVDGDVYSVNIIKHEPRQP